MRTSPGWAARPLQRRSRCVGRRGSRVCCVVVAQWLCGWRQEGKWSVATTTALAHPPAARHPCADGARDTQPRRPDCEQARPSAACGLGGCGCAGAVHVGPLISCCMHHANAVHPPCSPAPLPSYCLAAPAGRNVDEESPSKGRVAKAPRTAATVAHPSNAGSAYLNVCHQVVGRLQEQRGVGNGIWRQGSIVELAGKPLLTHTSN